MNDFTYCDLLKLLEIQNLFFAFDDGTTCILRLTKLSNNSFICLSSTILSEYGKLNIQGKDYSVQLKCKTQRSLEDVFEYVIETLESLPQALICKIKEYHSLVNGIERRSESRYEIGLKYWKDFGLLTKEQKLYINKKKSFLCILNNVSTHGCLITGESSSLKTSQEIVKLVCRFSNPQELVLQSAVICRIEHPTEKLFRYSLKFVEPLSIVWQKRIENYSKQNNLLVIL